LNVNNNPGKIQVATIDKKNSDNVVDFKLSASKKGLSIAVAKGTFANPVSVCFQEYTGKNLDTYPQPFVDPLVVLPDDDSEAVFPSGGWFLDFTDRDTNVPQGDLKKPIAIEWNQPEGDKNNVERLFPYLFDDFTEEWILPAETIQNEDLAFVKHGNSKVTFSVGFLPGCSGQFQMFAGKPGVRTTGGGVQSRTSGGGTGGGSRTSGGGSGGGSRTSGGGGGGSRTSGGGNGGSRTSGGGGGSSRTSGGGSSRTGGNSRTGGSRTGGTNVAMSGSGTFTVSLPPTPTVAPTETATETSTMSGTSSPSGNETSGVTSTVPSTAPSTPTIAPTSKPSSRRPSSGGSRRPSSRSNPSGSRKTPSPSVSSASSLLFSSWVLAVVSLVSFFFFF
jgi:hypothetical protein